MSFVFEAKREKLEVPFTVSDERKKTPVAILGATGSVGQRMVDLVARHPWFEIVQLVASEKNIGKPYEEAVNWLLPTPIPESIKKTIVTSTEKQSPAKIAFSALDASIAGPIETAWAQQGVAVVTNTKSHRMDANVPLVIPEVNIDHLRLIATQGFPKGGMIVANPNCVTIGLCIGLKPLLDAFSIDKVHVTTYQAISGAGFPGVPSFSIMDNVIPYISGEEEKVESEPLKIFATLEENTLIPPNLTISASCVRVPVIEGHLESISFSTKKPISITEVKNAFLNFTPAVASMKLPLVPKKPIHFLEQLGSPQPRLHKMTENGMGVCVGGLRPCSLFSYKFFLLSHNTIRGAAGGSVLIGEYLLKANIVHN